VGEQHVHQEEETVRPAEEAGQEKEASSQDKWGFG
jgi:hypothetical protein